MKLLLPIGLVAFLAACSSVVEHGKTMHQFRPGARVVLAPFFNATENPHAGEALDTLAGTVLLERGLPLYQTEEMLRGTREASGGSETNYLAVARKAEAAYVVMGTVHEYRYKTDLKGNPAVGLTLRLVDVSDGQTVWQGSSAKVGSGFASLTSTAHEALKSLVARMPLHTK